MGFLNGLKMNTGVLLVVLTFIFDKIGLTKDDAEAFIASVIAVVGGILTVIGFIHRVIKAKKK
jgi:uncharacterized membrane protein YphA (DoxX/SURF4 family)